MPLPKHIFYTCTSPTSAIPLISPYARQFGISVDTVLVILARHHRLFIDKAMIARYSNPRVPSWTSPTRARVTIVSTSGGIPPSKRNARKSDSELLAGYCE